MTIFSVTLTRRFSAKSKLWPWFGLLFYKFKSFSVFHGWAIFDRFLMLLIVQSHIGRVELQKVTNLVWDICSNFVIFTVFNPYLHQPLFCSEWQTCSNHIWLFKLFAYKIFSVKLNLPIMLSRIVSHILSILSSFFILMIQTPPSGDSYSHSQLLIKITYLPHRHFFIPEEKHIKIPW